MGRRKLTLTVDIMFISLVLQLILFHFIYWEGAQQRDGGLLCLWIFWLCYLRGPKFTWKFVDEDRCPLYNCGGKGVSWLTPVMTIVTIFLEPNCWELRQPLLQHAIFQRLAEDRVFNQTPSVLITAKGYPDIATR